MDRLKKTDDRHERETDRVYSGRESNHPGGAKGEPSASCKELAEEAQRVASITHQDWPINA